MYIVAFSILAVLFVFVCFWREVSPGLAWLALQYHTTPEVLAALYTGGDTHAGDAQRRAAVLAEQELRVALAPLVEEDIRAGVEQDLREKRRVPAASTRQAEVVRRPAKTAAELRAKRKKETTVV
jgi:hypothetical protein